MATGVNPNTILDRKTRFLMRTADPTEKLDDEVAEHDGVDEILAVAPPKIVLFQLIDAPTEFGDVAPKQNSLLLNRRYGAGIFRRRHIEMCDADVVDGALEAADSGVAVGGCASGFPPQQQRRG